MMLILIILTIIVSIWLLVSIVFFDSGYKSMYTYLDEDRTKTNWNLIALILNIYEGLTEVDWKDKIIPKTGIDKEIAEEEKEIAELERQKEKIEKLKNLKRRKEELFEDVHEAHEETSSDNWICPQCRREFKDLERLNNHRAWEHPF